MEIQHQDNAQKQQERKAIHEMYEYDNDLVQQLITVINSFFSPLTWILEETLYRRIKKEDKGWIDIDYLNRNPTIKQIFKKNGIPSQTRRKRNLLSRAIKRSILKKKKNLIKRKEYLNINTELKKVFYLQTKDVCSPLQNNQGVQKIQIQSQHCNRQNVLTKSNLMSIIKKITQQLMMNKSNGNLGHLQSFYPNTQHKQSKQIEFYGQFCQNTLPKVNQLNHLSAIQQQKSSQQQSYRWCFIYVPQIEIEKLQEFQNTLKNICNLNSSSSKVNLNNQMNLLNIMEESQNINQISYNSEYKIVHIYSLKEMIHQYYPIYDEICKQIGYKKQDIREERLRIRRKQKEKQRIRLLESVDLQKKIDVVNKYHVKLQVQRQRKAYLKKKQTQYQRKMRLREQRKGNKSKFKTDDNQKKDTFTQKLKLLLGLKNEEEQKQIPKKQEDLKNQELKKNQDMQIDQIYVQKAQQETQQKASKIKIKLPKYEQSQDEDIKGEQAKNENNEVYESFFEDQQDIPSSESSQENYEIHKKKSSKKKNDFKKKKIVKNHPKNQKNVNKVHKQTALSISVEKIKRQNKDSSTNNSNSHSNSAYNLRHKAPAQGSYLKMVESFEDVREQGHSQRTRNDRYARKFQNVIDQAHGISNSRSLRSTRKHNNQQA